MGRQPHHIVVYVCDECEIEFEAEGTDGISPAYPLGWLGITNAPNSGDLFCSWSCLGVFATRNAVERVAAAEQRKAERDALKDKATRDGGTI